MKLIKRQLALRYARKVVHLWPDVPDIVLKYLDSGEEQIREEVFILADRAGWDIVGRSFHETITLKGIVNAMVAIAAAAGPDAAWAPHGTMHHAACALADAREDRSKGWGDKYDEVLATLQREGLLGEEK